MFSSSLIHQTTVVFLLVLLHPLSDMVHTVHSPAPMPQYTPTPQSHPKLPLPLQHSFYLKQFQLCSGAVLVTRLPDPRFLNDYTGFFLERS
ncbi:uncharacterized, partial [Tachysurus ichikawai]